MNYTFTDDAIAHIAKLLQMAILTGTDIMDHLRSVSFVTNETGDLMIDPDCSENFEKNIQSMLEKATPLEEETPSNPNIIPIDVGAGLQFAIPVASLTEGKDE